MNNTNEEYIQLTPLRGSTEGAAVQMIWEYLKLSEEEQRIVHADLKSIVQRDKSEKDTMPENYRKVKHEEIADFEETISSLIRDLIFEASDIACWVFAKKYVDGWSLEQMVDDMPHAFKFIVAMDTLFEQNMSKKDTDDTRN